MPQSPITSVFWNGCAELTVSATGGASVVDRRKLRVHQLGKVAAALHEFVVSPGLDDASVVEHQNAGRIAHGGEPVGDDEGGAALHDLIERLRNARLGHRVERAGGFVENEDRRVFQQCAGDGEALALAAGQEPAALADPRFKAVRVAVDEIERLCPRSGFAQFRVGRVRLADPQVFADRTVEQKRLLKHDANVAAQAR